MNKQDLINELSRLCGIVQEYYDIWGNLRTVSPETKLTILRAMGHDTGSPEELRESLDRIRRKEYRLIKPVMVVSVNAQPEGLHLYIPEDDGGLDAAVVKWSIADEEGHRENGSVRLAEASAQGIKEVDGRRFREVTIPDRNDRTIGYYEVRVEVVMPQGLLSGQMRLIITPDRCYMPPALEDNGRRWGLSMNLYSLRSNRNQGIGDLSDLGEMLEWVGRELGGDFLGINPLHSISNQLPYGVSPYSPLSRLYSNLSYIDIRAVEDVVNSKRARAIIESPEFKEELERLRRADLIDYEGVVRLKTGVLDAAFRSFYEECYLPGTKRGKRFRHYISSEGKPLDDYAAFMALCEHFRDSGLYHWKDWPAGYHSPDTDKVRIFRKRYKERLLFYKYIQWLIDMQLEKAYRMATEAGMSPGLYRDLAVGSLSDGSDVWSNQGIFAPEVNVGAPPDDFSLTGQNWGFPPLIPEGLREQGYEFFVQLIRKNLRYAGALRIDHALGLFRLFWIPQGLIPQDGAYIHYPHEDLLRIIALESVRNHAVVIAEDLGTVGEEVRETLRRFGMLSFRLFYFERDYSTGEFLPPGAYPDTAITSTTTHDLPTLYGFWIGRDIEVKKRLNRYPDEEAYRKDLTNREYDRWRILRALKDAGVLPPGMPSDPGEVPVMTEELCLAIYRYLGKTPSRLLMVYLDDLLGIIDQQNLPGTIDEYPNWRRKIPDEIEDIMRMEVFRKLGGIRGD